MSHHSLVAEPVTQERRQRTLNRYVVVSNRGDGKVNVLKYGDGLLRTYDRDAFDPRAAITPDRVVHSIAEVKMRMQQGTGFQHRVAIPVRVAIELFGWKFEEFDVAP